MNETNYATQDAAIISAVLNASPATLGHVTAAGPVRVWVENRCEGLVPTIVVAVCGGGFHPTQTRKYKAAKELLDHVAGLTDLAVDFRQAIA